MAQVSYGTITITDNNDIEKIYMQYAQSTSNQVAPTSSSDWSTDIPTWRQGYYIWQRTVTKMSGVPLSSSSYGDPVCLTGSTGSTGTTGRGVSSIVTTYCNYGTGTPAADYSGWSTTVPVYDSSKPNYWVKTVITYTSGTPATDTTIYKDNGITSANSTAAAANSTAQTASGKADEAWNKADNAQTVAGNASSAISDLNQYFWRKKTASTNVPAGSYVTNIPGTDYQANPASGGYNSLVQADGIYLRNGITTLSSWTGSALTFNNPSNGSKVIELGSISNVPTLSFYNPSNNTIPMMRLSTNALTFGKPSDGQVQLTIGANGALQSGDFSIAANTSTFASLGTKIDLTYGEIYTPYFRVSQGSVSGGPAAGVYITGNFESTQANIGGTKPWVIKTFKDSKQINLASITGPNSSFIQLGSSGSWLLHSNKIHTAWYISGNYLEYPLLNEKYYDFGINLPTSLSDKFLYIRYNTGTNLSSIYQNDTNWVYPFYIDASGNVHAPAYYVGSEPLTGGVGSIAEKIINSDSTYGKGSATQPVYIDSNGRPATTTYALNAAGAKGVVTDLANNTTSTNLPTAAAVVSYVTSRGYITSFTDKNVQTNLASNSSTFYIAGPTSTATTTGTLKVITDAKVTVDGNGKATITATNFSGTASRATADSDGNTINSTYLKLSGGNVTGAVTFGSSVSVDELTAGDLVVNGNASFTNNAQFNTINGVAVGSSPKFTDTTYSSLSSASGGTAVSLVTTGEKYTWNNKQDKLTNPVTGTGTSGYLTKWTGTNTIGNGPALGTDATKFLNNKGEWVVPAGTGVTSVAASGSGGITISGSPITTSGTIAIGLNLSTAINGLGEGTSPATRDDYAVVQYAGGGTTTTSYHRRKLSNVFAALSSSDITTALGYTPYNATNPNGYTSNTGTVTSIATSSPITGGTITGSGTIGHATSGVGNAVTTAGLYKFKYDTYGHITGVAAVVKADITGLGIPAQDTTYSNASTTTAGLMSAADKKKLDDIQVDSSGQAVAANVAGRWGIDVTFSDTNVAQVGHANSAITASNTQASTVSSATTKTTLSFGSIVKLPYVSYDTYGHVTSKSEVYFQLPAAPSSTTNATNDSDGNQINTTYLKRSGGTMSGDLNFATIATWPTAEGETYPISSKGIAWSGTSDGARIFYRVDGSDNGNLVIQSSDDAGAKVIFSSSTSNGDGIILNSNDRTIYPIANNVGSLGTSSLKWANVYATTFNGALSGNATSATKANLTTTTNAVAYYTDTAGTFGSKASANGVLYATSANGALNWGTLPIAQGGTGATSAVNAAWNLLHVADPSDLNTAKRGGSFKISNTTTNTPIASMWGATINVTDDSAGGNNGTSGSTWQIVLQSSSNNMWLRCITNTGSWSDYAKFYTTSNKPTKSDVGLGNVENKSSATIRGELTSSNVTTALGYTPVNKAGDTMSGTLALKPASGEGGQLELRASTANTTQAGIALDQLNSTFRIFGIASADGTTKTGTGTPLVIDPYGKTITGGYTITGTLSGNATTATTLQTSRTIFGKSFNGSANVAGQALVYGDYTATASSRYAHSGLQIREQDLVGNAQSDILYAPTIGFHWSGRIAASLIFHSDGIFYLRKQDGVTRATLDANLNGNAATATKATQDGSGNTITSKYVTIDTNQTITAAQKTFNGATRWSITNSTTGSKYGACNYDSTLDALVFSFGII